MIIKGTNKIKGVLDLTGIGKQLTSGDEFSITENEFYDHTVQIAVKMGYITYRQGTSLIDMHAATGIRLKNIYNRPISINALDSEVRPGDVFTLTAEQVNNSDIRSAIAKGLVEVVSSVQTTKGTEATVKVGDVFGEKKSAQTKKTEPVLETNEELGEPKIVESTKVVDSPTNIIDTETPDPIRNKDIPDPKKQSIVWNPNKDPVAHTTSKMDSISMDNDGPIAETNVDIGDISFVDDELDAKRRESHPVLKNKPQESKSDDLDFI